MNAESPIAAGGRFLIALIYLISGAGKLAAPAATLSYIAAANLPFPFLAYILAIGIEIGGGVLLILGFRSRIVALVMAGFTLATALAFHRHLSDPNQMMHFLKNLSMTGGLLQIVAFGGARLSADARLKRQPGASPHPPLVNTGRAR
jgi:putative oxidoreductase